jgi:hypothetical protein
MAIAAGVARPLFGSTQRTPAGRLRASLRATVFTMTVSSGDRPPSRRKGRAARRRRARG